MNISIIIKVIIYLSTLGIGAIFLAMFYFMLRKSADDLPASWKKVSSLTKFQIGVLSLTIHFLVLLICEVVSIYVAMHGIYNTFVISIGLTVYTPFLFGFGFSYTQTTWRRYSYILLYLILIGYFINGGYYLPGSVFSYSSALMLSSIYFLAALIHFTDLLVNPKSEYFRFQLKVNICILVYNLLSAITTSFLWYYTEYGGTYLHFLFDINYYTYVMFYFMLDFIFIYEILKLRRRYNHL